MKRIVVVWYFLSYFKVSICLRVVGVSVPAFKQRGESATLSCDYELEGGKLYSVKWYRDHEEFYRFMPKLRPPQRAHSLDGVTVDLDKSTARRVHLRDLSLKSRGLYRCEVSKEAPSFHSAQAEAFMEVYYFPRESPRIIGHERAYAALEPLDVNCSSAGSFPAPDLQWHVDGQKPIVVHCWTYLGLPKTAPTFTILRFSHPATAGHFFQVTERSWLIPYGARPAPQDLLVSTIGLRAPAKPMMQLRCVATLGTHQRERTVVIETNSSSVMKAFSLFSLIPVVVNMRIYDKIL